LVREGAPSKTGEGYNDASLIRDLFDLVEWSKYYFSNDQHYLATSHELAAAALSELGEEKQPLHAEIKYRLPGRAGPGGNNNTSILWVSRVRDLPERIRRADCNTEKRIILSIISELRVKMALDLDSNPTFERGLVLQVKAKLTVDYLVVGSSNASRLARALDGMGYSTCLVSKPGWRIDRGSVEQLTKMVKNTISDQVPGTVILQLLDNSTFYAKTQDGSWLPPVADDSGRYHMPGEIRVAARDTQVDHMRALQPLFEILKQHKILIVTPMQRYIVGSCCNSSSHGTNRAAPDFKNKMLEDLDNLKRTVKDCIFRQGNRSIKLLDPNVDMRGLEVADIWGADPVHPRAEIYTRIAEGVVRMSTALEEKDSVKRKRSNSLEEQSEHHQGPHRGRGGERPGASRGASGRGRGLIPHYGQQEGPWRPRGNARFQGGRGGRGYY
jgi:hypothetical protein